MNAVKGIYRNGMIVCIEKPVFQEPVEVLIIFPKPEKKVKQIRGLCEDAFIDDEQIRKDLKELSRLSEKHLLEEWNGSE